MNRAKLIHFIYEKLAQLEKDKEYCSTIASNGRYDDICIEMNHLRVTLQNVMNSSCPIILDEM
jgi:hypothetical protein